MKTKEIKNIAVVIVSVFTIACSKSRPTVTVETEKPEAKQAAYPFMRAINNDVNVAFTEYGDRGRKRWNNKTSIRFGDKYS
jgi:hypothetical protein